MTKAPLKSTVKHPTRETASTTRLIQPLLGPLGQSTVVLFKQDTDLRYTWVFSPHPGLSDVDVLGKTDEDFLQLEEAAHLTTIKRHVLETGEATREDLRTTVDGQAYYSDYSVQPECDADGATIGITGVSLDISERKRTQEALQRRDRQLERLLEAALRLNTKHELESLLKEVADSAREVIGCRFAALGVLDPEGKALENFVVSGMDPAEVAKLGKLPTGGGLLGTLIRDQRAIRLADLSLHPDSVGLPPGHPPMHGFLGVPVIGRGGPIGNLYFTEKEGALEFTEEDESAAKMLAAEAAIAVENARLMTELRTLQVSRNRFYAMVNHELRNALTGVYGWSELLMRKLAPNPPRAAQETLESAEYAVEMLNDLLDLSRLDADKIEPEIGHALANDIVQEAVSTVLPSAKMAGVDIAIDGLDEKIECETDRRLVRQILVNLLRNAIQHSGSEDVTVATSMTDDQLTFCVSDRGEGIDYEQQAIIFDAYMRAEKKGAGGTGLGLTLCRRLARLLGGEIEVESTPGSGARFTVWINRHLTP